MRNGTINWDALDDGVGVVGDGDVEYVGIVEEESTVPMGSNGVSSVRQRAPVGRRLPFPNQRRQQVRRPVPEPITDSIRVATANGEVTLNQDAIRTAAHSPVQQMGGQTVRRAAPGTYLVMKPSQAERMQGMGAGFDIGGLFEGIGTALEAGAGLATGIMGGLQQQQVLEYQASAAAAAQQAALQTARQQAASAAEQRRLDAEQAQRDFELQMARTQAQATAAAAAARAAASSNAIAAQQAASASPAGISPAVWVFIALAGVGAIGSIVWLVVRKKDE